MQKRVITKKTYIPPSKWERFIVIVMAMAFIFGWLYMALRDNSIPDSELSTIYVTLKDTPKYDEYKIKSRTHRDIILTTKEYHKEFKITGMTYKVTDHTALKSNIFAGDKVELKIKKSELNDLNKNSYWSNYNDVYGLVKNTSNYIDLEQRKELLDEDRKGSYFLAIFGLVILPYGLIRGKPLISMDRAITTICVIGVILLLISSC